MRNLMHYFVILHNLLELEVCFGVNDSAVASVFSSVSVKYKVVIFVHNKVKLWQPLIQKFICIDVKPIITFWKFHWTPVVREMLC